MTKFQIALTHVDHGTAVTLVDIATDDSFEQVYMEMIQQARKNAASHHVHYESFGNDSDYLKRLDEVGEEFGVVNVEMVGDAPKVRYAILGEYSTDEQGLWDDHVMARNPEDAMFAAKWTMAINERADPNKLDDFQTTMGDITIKDCYPEPVTLSEATAFLGTLSRMTIPGDEDFSEESDQSDTESLQALVRQARDMLAGRHVAA